MNRACRTLKLSICCQPPWVNGFELVEKESLADRLLFLGLSQAETSRGGRFTLIKYAMLLTLENDSDQGVSYIRPPTYGIASRRMYSRMM